MSIGNRIYELRSKHNLSQEELANELQVSRQTISKWESEQSLPDTDRLIALCNYFKVSGDYLLFGKEDKKEVSYEWINAFLLSIVGFIGYHSFVVSIPASFTPWRWTHYSTIRFCWIYNRE